MSRKTALVTGGGGFLGSAIVRQLIAENWQVRAFQRSPSPFPVPLPGVTVIQGDIRDAEAVSLAAKGTDVVFHTAAKAGVWGATETYATINVKGTENVIAACLAHGCRLIHTSSPSVIFDGSDMEGVDTAIPYPETYKAAYPQTKAEAEKKVRKAVESGLSAIILRPHLIWGPGDPHLVPRILSRHHRLFRIGKKENRIDTVYIDNAANAHLLADQALCRHPEFSGKIYFLTNDEPIPLWDMINGILAAGGLPPVKRTIPTPVARMAGCVLESIFSVLKSKEEPPLTRFSAQELSTAHWFDITDLKTDLGYVPTVSIEKGLQQLADFLAAPKNGWRKSQSE